MNAGKRITKWFVIDKALNVITFGEAFIFFVFVLINSPLEIAGEADVQDTVASTC